MAGLGDKKICFTINADNSVSTTLHRTIINGTINYDYTITGDTEKEEEEEEEDESNKFHCHYSLNNLINTFCEEDDDGHRRDAMNNDGEEDDGGGADNDDE